MSGINPEAEQPTSRQMFEQSERNPVVSTWGSEGGIMPTPEFSENWITQPGPALSQDAGLVNYNDQGSSDGVENEGEREG